MAALPYMQLYIADYLADTFHLTTEEHGAYLLILFNYWQTGKPVRSDRLASVARMSNDRWLSVENTLSEFFNIGDNGVWFHDRVEQDLAKVYAKSTQASNAGRVSAEKRASSKHIESQDNSNGRSTSVERTYQRNGNHTDTDTDTDNRKKTSCDKSHPGFDLFWATWQPSQRKVNRAGCLKKWQAKKLEPEAQRIIAHITAMQKTENWRTGFEPAPMTYLNQARYDDDIPEPTGRPIKIELPRTDEQWIAAGERLGLNARPGEFMDQFKGRVRSQLEAANG